MRKHAKRRSFRPNLTLLEQRRLLSFTPTWIGQDGSDFTGSEGKVLPQRPDDYQDVHIRLTGLSTTATVTRVVLSKPGSGAWDWNPSAKWENAVYRPDTAHPGQGDFYMEAPPPGTVFEKFRVEYNNGSYDEVSYSVSVPASINPNLRVTGKQVAPTYQGQTAHQDWTGPYIGVGPDGFQDVQIHLENLSAGADCHVTVAAPSLGKTWETGRNLSGYWNAELLNRSGANETLGTSADVFFSPGAGVNLTGVTLTVTVTYEYLNPNDGYTNRSGKTDTKDLTAGSMTLNLAMPAVSVSNLLQVKATSQSQDLGSPGKSHVKLDATSLPTGKSLSSVTSAVLSDRYGSNWGYNVASGTTFAAMQYTAGTGVFDFPPVRDEAGSILTLVVTFNDGSQAVARFAGAASDVGRLFADTRVGASAYNVSNAAALLAALQTPNLKPNIHLQAGTYTLNQPLRLTYPVQITADPGTTLTFNPASSQWNGSSGAIIVSSSHVSLDGFAIRFQGNSSAWTGSNRFIIQATGGSNVDLSFTHLDVQAPAAAVTTGYEPAIDLMGFDEGDSGLIASNILKGGGILLRVGPWTVLNNDYQGAVANTITPGFLSVDRRSHDLTIVGNHLHTIAGIPAGVTQRFLILGNGDYGQGIGNRIENNTIDGGIGTIPDDQLPKDKGYENRPEIIVLETYQPRFEGKPSAVSPDGFIVQVVQAPLLRGPDARIGDVVSIVTGPYAGQWRMIAQTLGPSRYLLDEPLPLGDYVITIGRGFVNQTYRGNVIDVSGRPVENVGLLISGNDWGSSIVGNTFRGGLGLHIGSGPSEKAYDDWGLLNPAPWGWSHLPVFDSTIDGNTFDESRVLLGVAHGGRAKANSERTYLTGTLSNNEFRWSGSPAPAVTIGVAADPDLSHNTPRDYTLANYSWLSLYELRLTTLNNWGRDPSTGTASTMRVYAATFNGTGVNNQTIALPTASLVTAMSRGQDGSDYAGGSSAGPDGLQDIHIVVAGLPAGKAIQQVTITGYGGGQWDYAGTPTPFSVKMFRHGTTADLYIQPYQDETGGRYFTVGIQYADMTWVYPTIDAIFATLRLPALETRSTPTGTITARGENAAAGQGKAQAFDGNALTKWLDFSGTSWIQYQFASGAAQVITQYTITSADDNTMYPGRAPRSWTLKGSNDGVTWTTLDVRTNEANTFNLTPRTYRFSNATAFKMYKFDDIYSNGDPIIQIGEIQLQSPQSIAIRAVSSTPVGSFQGDAYAFGGVGYTTTHAIDLQGVTNPAPEAVYQVERNATSFNYQIPGLRPGGVYTVRLHFAENTATAVGQRTFDVGINTTWVLNQFDIFAAAGGMYKAVVREFTATASASGTINVIFDGTSQPGGPKVAKINGIEIVVPASIDLARGKTATSSTDESATYAASKAIDGNNTTRWSSGQWMRNNSIGWITVDLGAVYDINRVTLNWEAAYAVDFQIQVSDDGINWTTAQSVVDNATGGVRDYPLSARGRYVRIYCTRFNATSNYSLYDLNVYGA
jgi:F5/8 type C domain/Malectin domain